MKKTLFLAVTSLFLAQVAWAVPFTGSINGGAGGGLTATEQWNSSSTVLSWDVDQDVNNLWHFDYTFTVPEKDISHLIIEVSESFTLANIKDGTTGGFELGTFGQQGGSNPGIPGDLYGLKWDTGELKEFSFSIVTDRGPMWGDFYSKDGKNNQNDVYAYNTSFGQTSNADFDANPSGFVLVPDTTTNGGGGGGGQQTPIPEPSTMLLLGAGLVGLGIFGRRKISK